MENDSKEKEKVKISFSKFVDHFIIIGVDHKTISNEKETTLKPQVLDQFSSNNSTQDESFISNLHMFCFPNGFNKSEKLHKPSCFPLIFTNHLGERCFVQALCFYEPLFTNNTLTIPFAQSYGALPTQTSSFLSSSQPTSNFTNRATTNVNLHASDGISSTINLDNNNNNNLNDNNNNNNVKIINENIDHLNNNIKELKENLNNVAKSIEYTTTEQNNILFSKLLKSMQESEDTNMKRVIENVLNELGELKLQQPLINILKKSIEQQLQNADSQPKSIETLLPWQKEGSFFTGVCGRYIQSQLLTRGMSWRPEISNLTLLGYWLSNHGNEDTVSRNAAYAGYYDGNFFRIMLKWYDELGITSSQVASKRAIWFDIGANIGTEFAFAAQKKMTVLAFEPIIENVHKICETVWLNGWWDNVYVFHMAFANENKETQICFLKHNSGTSAIGRGACTDKTNVYHFDEWFERMGFYNSEVESETNDAILKSLEKNERADRISSKAKTWLVHIDVEGSEFLLMSAAKKFLSNPRVARAVVEVSRALPTPFGSVQDMLQMWLDYGFTISPLFYPQNKVDRSFSTGFNMTYLLSNFPGDYVLTRD
eukprot:TRINITY_DN1100_c0_g3_i1.p1 TRINITY_DN1100_c0_g3~~TRINITY_DN1100_c0_g3_i1.p1  ORF type:complete len:597 (-),score=262.38 TRINITY_DN1100_c0_g3_i1:20-1810(-)